ncbi:MAG: DUF5519 family protein [Microbacterium sp.]
MRVKITAPLVAVGAAVTAAALLARRDYDAWVGLGPGGLPHTFRGWLTMTRHRLDIVRRGYPPRDAAALEERAAPTAGGPFLAGLPARRGDRPRVEPFPIPHRLASCAAEAGLIAALQDAFTERAGRDRERIVLAKSHFEMHNVAVTARLIRYDHVDALMAHGEVGHVHPSDGSMHMVLHPLDAAAAIRAGWGELHPLSGMGWLPGAYLMVYPPTSEEELSVVLQLLDAAIEYVLG